MKPLFPDVIVNGEKISAANIAAEAQMHNAPAGKPGLAWRAAARALVVRKLLIEAALRSDTDATPIQLDDSRFESAEEALIRAYLESEIDPPPVTEAHCRAVYEARPSEAKDVSYDQAITALLEGLERAAWAKSAHTLVERLVSEARVEGIDLVAVTSQ